MMHPSFPEPASQRLVAAVLIVLTVIGVISLFKDLSQRSRGKSRIDWPTPSSVKP